MAEGSLVRTGADFSSLAFSLVTARVGVCSVREDLSVLTGEEADGCLSDDLLTLGSLEFVLRVVEDELFTLSESELLLLAPLLFMFTELFCSLFLFVIVSVPCRFSIPRVSDPGRE